MHGGWDPAMLREIVDWPLDRLSGAKSANVVDKQLSVNRVGMIEILLGAIAKCKVRRVLVIVVLLKQQHAFFGQGFGKTIGDSRLTGACAAADSDG